MSRSHSESSLRQVGDEQRRRAHGSRGDAHASKRARREEDSFTGDDEDAARPVGNSMGRAGASTPPLRVERAPNNSHAVSPLRTSFIASARHSTSPPASPYRHPHPAGLAPSPTSQFPPSPSSALHSAAPIDSLVGPQRSRSHHPRRRATSLPPPPRHSSHLSSPPRQQLTAPFSHRSPTSPSDHRRRREKLHDSRPSVSTLEAQLLLSQQPLQEICADLERHGGARPLSQGDLLAYHAARAVKEGGRRVTLVPTSLNPPITRSTLRELDLSEILRNPQLRHDCVHDLNLMFRPNYDGER